MPIERAIARTERFIAAIDGKARRCAWRASTARSEAWRSRWLSALGTAAQRRENAVYLLNGLKAIEHRPEVSGRRVTLKFSMAKASLPEKARKRA